MDLFINISQNILLIFSGVFWAFSNDLYENGYHMGAYASAFAVAILFAVVGWH